MGIVRRYPIPSTSISYVIPMIKYCFVSLSVIDIKRRRASVLWLHMHEVVSVGNADVRYEKTVQKKQLRKQPE